MVGKVRAEGYEGVAWQEHEIAVDAIKNPLQYNVIDGKEYKLSFIHAHRFLHTTVFDKGLDEGIPENSIRAMQWAASNKPREVMIGGKKFDGREGFGPVEIDSRENQVVHDSNLRRVADQNYDPFSHKNVAALYEKNLRELAGEEIKKVRLTDPKTGLSTSYRVLTPADVLYEANKNEWPMIPVIDPKSERDLVESARLLWKTRSYTGDPVGETAFIKVALKDTQSPEEFRRKFGNLKNPDGQWVHPSDLNVIYTVNQDHVKQLGGEAEVIEKLKALRGETGFAAIELGNKNGGLNNVEKWINKDKSQYWMLSYHPSPENLSSVKPDAQHLINPNTPFISPKSNEDRRKVAEQEVYYKGNGDCCWSPMGEWGYPDMRSDPKQLLDRGYNGFTTDIALQFREETEKMGFIDVGTLAHLIATGQVQHPKWSGELTTKPEQSKPAVISGLGVFTGVLVSGAMVVAVIPRLRKQAVVGAKKMTEGLTHVATATRESARRARAALTAAHNRIREMGRNFEATQEPLLPVTTQDLRPERINVGGGRAAGSKSTAVGTSARPRQRPGDRPVPVYPSNSSAGLSQNFGGLNPGTGSPSHASYKKTR
jgi:hypothetical protein